MLAGAGQAQAQSGATQLAVESPRFVPIELLRSSGQALPAVLARHVSVHRSRVPLEHVLQEIASQADLGLSYGEGVARSHTLISLDLQQSSVAEALEAAARDTEWRVLVTLSGQITVVPRERAGEATRQQPQVGVVTGRVTDAATGRPLDGARVSVVGTQLAAAANADGRFTITGVPVGQHTVRVSRIGFAPLTQTVGVTAGQRATITVAMTAQAVQLNAVVSTGYGTQTKANTTGANDVVSGTEITNRPVSNVTKGLQGLIPGVVAQDFGGRPGADGAQVLIRGASTLGDNGALIIVDGVPGEINNLNPYDIESVSVLKDAASAAIYGARAGNGVIIVRTRRGRNTGKLQLSYDGYAGSQTAQDLPQRVDIRTELETVNQVYVGSGQAPKYTPGYIDSTARGLDPVKYPNTNWLGKLYQTAPISNQTLRIAGGNDLATVLLSANYFDQQGVLTTQNSYKRYQLRANSSFNISKRLTAGANLMVMDEKTVAPRGEGDAEFRALHDTPPTSLAQYPDGSYSWSRSAFNPLALLREQGFVNSRWLTGSINTFGTYDFGSGFKVNGQFSSDNKDNRNLVFQPTYSFADEVVSPTNVRMQNVRTNSTDARNNGFNYDAQVTGEWARTLGVHSLRLLGGYEQRRATFDSVLANRAGAYSNALQLPGNGDVSFQNTGSSATETRLIRQFGRLNYGWNDRYLLEFDVSHDGSSRFGPNKKYGTFPSASAAWRVSNEPFFRAVPFINDLKIRGSWGRLGNDRIADYLFQQTLSVNAGNYLFGNGLAAGAIPGRIANPDIGWETTEQTNGGVDVELLRNRLTFTGDVYKKRTSGILLSVPISSLVGQAAPTQNAASVQNTGWEAALNWRGAMRSFNYSVGFNIANNNNRITNLPGGDQINVAGAPGPSIRRVGYPIDAIFGVQAVGIFQTADEVKNWATQSPKTGPGDLKYKDQNGDGKIDANDRVVIGDRFPHYTYGVNSSARWRNFDASVLFQGVGKRDVFLDGALIEGPTWENFFATYLNDAWTPQNPNAKWPRFVFRSDQNQNAPGSNSWYVRNGRYLSLKNLNLGYTLPQQLATRGHLSSARVYVAGTNVFTWSPLKGIVPAEANPYSSRGTYYYQTRNWTVGTNIGF